MGTLLVFASLTAKAQFYYKDIINTEQLSATLKSYKDHKVRNIDIKSFENDGTESEGFICRKKISKDYKTVTLFTKYSLSEPSLFISELNVTDNVFVNIELYFSDTENSTNKGLS